MRLFLTLSLCFAANAHALSVKPIEFKAANGKTVSAELGTFQVPAHHANPDGPTMTLSFVRFGATTNRPGNPIVYLAGGPGGSGIDTAKGRRFPLFMALRQFGDVIALDQRGTGMSDPPPRCRADHPYPVDEPFTEAAYLEYARRAAKDCQAWWRDQGVDLSAYNTRESADDLETLRRELDVDRLDFWSISYGTHLAMAAIRRMGDEHIGRVILASPEGLDQTVKLPARWDGYLHRLAALVASNPETARVFPDLEGTLRKVLDGLEKKPARVQVTPNGADQPVTISLGPVAVRYTLALLSKDPSGAARIPIMVYGLAAGRYESLARKIYGFVYAQPVSFGAMSMAMDIASGISDERLERVRKQAETAFMGDILNYPMPQFRGLLEIPVLGDDFRAPISSSVPALVLTGTLDGRTFPEAHAEVLEQFSNGRELVIENAGHDLFMASPKVTSAIETFMRGESPPRHIAIPPPEFVVP